MTKEEINKTLDRLDKYEERFDKAEQEWKKMASAWLLATFGAIAFVLKGEIQNDTISVFQAEFLIVNICFFGAVGLLTIWIIDQITYHRFFKSAFFLGIILENKYPENIPPYRTARFLFINGTGKGGSIFLKTFYQIPLTILLIISIPMALEHFAKNSLQFSFNNGVILFCVLGILLIILSIEYVTRRSRNYRNIIDAVHPDYPETFRLKKYQETMKTWIRGLPDEIEKVD